MQITTLAYNPVLRIIGRITLFYWNSWVSYQHIRSEDRQYVAHYFQTVVFKHDMTVLLRQFVLSHQYLSRLKYYQMNYYYVAHRYLRFALPCAATTPFPEVVSRTTVLYSATAERR